MAHRQQRKVTRWLSKMQMATCWPTVRVVKDLKVKGSSSTLKVGTKVKNIRLAEGDHKIDGFGPMKLKSEFVKKS